MAVYLVRHAVAVGRANWDDDDERRPLTPRGGRQAVALVERFAAADVRRVLSSPATRCRETVAPLAAARGLEVTVAAELAEGATTSGALDLLRAAAGQAGDSVLCSHGDVIPEVLRRLDREGVDIDRDGQIAKASVWELQVEGDAVVRGVYHPPPG